LGESRAFAGGPEPSREFCLFVEAGLWFIDHLVLETLRLNEPALRRSRRAVHE
jgi:hypothetical protein